MTEDLKAGFSGFADTAKSAWGGIVDAIRAGYRGLAAEIALAGVSLEWAKAVHGWTGKRNAFKGGFVDGWHDAVAGLKLMFWDFTAWIARTIAGRLGTQGGTGGRPAAPAPTRRSGPQRDAGRTARSVQPDRVRSRPGG